MDERGSGGAGGGRGVNCRIIAHKMKENLPSLCCGNGKVMVECCGEVYWGEVYWDEVYWGEVYWGEVYWDEVYWGEVYWGEVYWGE
ncbi:hypothetical protein Pmani_033982 [Petrolisthes manimaculis]|uniref:Uncharacterized protein n=1 Tax=Petrolisthes manimaculis TaxID=1843537 RepID=A0AAE1TPW0_9EUCA|nr:hypothetical protein Pmani_033982 [Petrolisthes manimaculis]